MQSIILTFNELYNCSVNNIFSIERNIKNSLTVGTKLWVREQYYLDVNNKPIYLEYVGINMTPRIPMPNNYFCYLKVVLAQHMKKIHSRHKIEIIDSEKIQSTSDMVCTYSYRAIKI